MDKHHSKKAILKLTLITTSILLMHSNQVNAEEQELKNQEQSPVIANVAQQPSPSVTTNTVEKTSVTAASASNTAKEMGDTSVKNDKTEDELLEELSKNLDTSNLGADLEEEYPSKPETTNNKESNVVTNASTAIAQKVPSAYEEVKPESKSSLAVLDTSKITKLQAITQRGKGNVVAIIDTGFDINHDIFRLDSPKDDKHSFKTKTEFEELKAKHNITYGKWVNDKIVFAHNYANNTETVADIAAAMKDGYGSEAKNISHGTHVAGIFVGNSKRPAINGLLLEGAAPNAQVLLMRIPDKIDSDKFGEAYAKAITDAVNLGAKTINMSIGKTADSLIALNDKVKLALKLASEKGVAVVVAAGNEGAFGMDYSKPLSTNPDYGTVNSPAISEDTLSVASYESLKTISEVVETTIEGKLVKLPIVTSKPFDKGKAYDVVYANYGAKKDFEGKDFKGKFALKPQALLDTNWQKVILRDKETQVRFTIDASQFSQKLKEQMANGYFLEGFVRFKEAKDSNQELMSIPFVGFNGDFANLQALETPIYKTLSKGSFYYKPNDTTHKDQLEYNESAPFESNNYTALLTQSASWGYVDYVKNGGELELAPESPKRIILGTFENKVEDKTIHLLERDAANNPYFAISPNKDGNRDEITPQATFLRNVKDISAQVLDQNGNVIWQSKVLPSYRKNFHNNPKQSDGHYRMDALQWSGLDKDGKVVADGFYTYRLRYTPVAEGANSQESDFKVQVSTKSPNLPSRAQFDETNRTLSLAMPKESSYVPTYRLQLVLSHVVKDEEYGDETSYHYFHIDQEGKVTLPKTVKIGESEVAVDPKALTLVVEDKAGNFATVKLSDLLNKAVVSEKENAIVISNSFKYFDNLKKEPMFISKKEKVVNKNLEEIILVKPQTTVTTQSLSKEITKSGNEKVLTSTNNNSSRVAKIISPKHNGDSVNHTLPSTSDRATNGLFVGTLALLSSLLLYLKPKKTKNNSK
ncbi:TPA: S8 family serine peptidase [Streptococcus agalactiae]